MNTLRLSRSLWLAALALASAGCGGRPDPAPTVAWAEIVRGTLTLTRAGHTETVRGRSRVEVETVVSTGEDGRGAIALDSGAWILFDRSASGTPSLSGLTLANGRVWVDASVAEETTVETAHGTLVAHEAAFAVSLEDGATVVYCASGELSYRSGDVEAQLVQGETLRMTGTDAIAEPAALWDDWTGGLADPARNRFREHDPIGTLRGRGAHELGVARTALPVRAHEVNVELRGDLAVTEVTQTFFNARPDTLEGEWRIRIPEDAIVESFAVDMGGGFVEATPLATGIGAGYSLSWYGPEYAESRLAYDAPGRLRARISPITNRTEVRVRIRWSEWLRREGARRTYVYPMRSDGEPPALAEFMLSIDTRAANAGALRAGMGATDESGRVTLRVSDFRPRADFTLDLFDPEGAASETAVAYPVAAPGGVFAPTPAEGDETYVLFDLDTASFGEAAAAEAPLELVILLDASGATETEDLEIARAIVEATLAQLAPTDRVTVRIADVTAHVPEGGSVELVAPEAGGDALSEALSRLEPSGATDLGESLRAAAEIVAGRPRGAVLYLGDALPTTGALDATALRTVLATVDAPPRFFALAIGEGANLELLRALFGHGAQAVREREGAARVVMTMLADAAQPTLRGVTVSLGEGIERVFPRGPLTAPVGGHLVLVGRQAGELPTEIVVRGTRDGADFESTLPVTRGTVADQGHVRRRWASSRLLELLDADAGREALVELGTRFGIVTPWTSLVVGGITGQTIPLIRGFDPDPLEVPWGLSGGAVSSATLESSRDGGWRRRVARGPSSGSGAGMGALGDVAEAAESTWAPRARAIDVGPVTAADGDGGLARAAIERTLETSERGPEGCFERRTIVRPDLSGNVSVSVTVRGDGGVEATEVTGSTVGDAEIEDCVRTEVSGISFPATEGGTVVVTHVYTFRMAERELGARRSCSDASHEPIETRRTLWSERLTSRPGVDGALGVWREARGNCELDSWRARRALADLLLGHVGSLYAAVSLYQQLAGDPSVSSYLRRAILRRARTPSDIDYLRRMLGLEPNVTWWLFGRLWNGTSDPAARLRLVRRWLAVAPDDIDLRLRLLSLLEQTNELAEARRVARELRADPLADARVRTDVGEFWLRQGDEAEARRVFSEIVEHTPLDPWARRRLGDLYRAHEWSDDAYREYQTLARLRPDDDSVLLLLGRAAANAGRIDEALRLEQRLSETADDGADEGAASAARLWTAVRLARLLRNETSDSPDTMRESIRRRVRESGILRDPPDALVALTFEHPDDAPSLSIHWPDREDPTALEPSDLGDVASGVLGIRIRERQEGEHVFVITRPDSDSLRDWHAELMVLLRPGTPDERILVEDIVLTRTERTVRYRLTDAGTLERAPAPPPTPPRRPAAP